MVIADAPFARSLPEGGRETIRANTACRPSGGKGRWHRIDDQRSTCGAYQGGKGLLCTSLSQVPLRERCVRCFPRRSR